MTIAVAARPSRERRNSPTDPSNNRSSDQPVVVASRHDALDAAARRWLAEGDTPENVADYARALRDLLRTPAG